jgi:Zn-dependent M28 family amino/carboxypeptidase
MAIPGRWFSSKVKFGLVFSALLAAGLAAGCGGRGTYVRIAEESINAKDLEEHALALASDEFQGRRPFTEGERKTVEYIAGEFERMGFEGANKGSYFQDVPMVEMTVDHSGPVTVVTPAGRVDLSIPEDVIVSSPQVVEKIDIRDSGLVFAGYGIVEPEYGWNDYEGLDPEGKTVLVLVNDPGFATGDESLFDGKAMTYHGRWTYKYEEAARWGALGVIVIHETSAAGYPWSVLQNGSTGPNLVLRTDDDNMSRCGLEGWMTQDAARRIFAIAGVEFDTLASAAARRGFKPVLLDARLSLTIEQRLRFDTSKNVVAVLTGAKRPDECVVYTSHWDHFGIGAAVAGDSIYNGAADNALPIACMLETAKAFARLEERPARSVVFVAVTAEEAGLLGSEYYVTHPLFPLEKTVAGFNYELFLPLGRMKDVTIYGFGKSDLDDYVAAAARAQGRYITPDPTPENGMYYRTDHFSFAKAGVPALFFKGWTDQREHGPEWTAERIREFWTNVYHTPDDEYDPSTADLAGIVEDAKLFFKIGYRLSMEETFPQWREGSEFRRAAR